MIYTKEQTAANRKKWVEALRSGKYKQCKNKLRKTDLEVIRHCCLGVACDISGLGKWASNNSFTITGDLDWVTNYPPVSVTRWLGLSDAYGSYINSNLAAQNDKGLTFKEIADIIESEPEGLVEV